MKNHGLTGNLILILFMLLPCVSAAKEAKQLTLREFIETASQKDASFQLILMDEMKLQYKKTLSSVPADIMADVKGQYGFAPDSADADSKEGSVSLSRIFPRIGTEIKASYSIVSSLFFPDEASAFTASISVPLAKNAFGYTNRMLEEIAGYEKEIASHQVTEAYEDYLAYLINMYYTWYSNYAAMRTAEAAFSESLKLASNMKERKKSGIAYSVDVSKASLQSLEKEESLAGIKQSYNESLNLIMQAVRSDEAPVPVSPGIYNDKKPVLPADINDFLDTIRSVKIMKLLVKNTEISENIAFNSLFPSASVSAGYELEGTGAGLENTAHNAFAGFSVSFPMPWGSHESASHEIAKINRKQQELSYQYSLVSFETDIKNLYTKIETQRKKAEIAGKKVSLASSVLKEETRYYNQARSSLNDLISAINNLENAKFDKISQEITLNSLITEWFRLTDSLITGAEIKQ